VEGAGSEIVILLHGLNSHSGTWRKVLPALARHATVIAPSLPSHQGRGSPELAARYAELVSALCASMKIRSASVVGNSMGGWVAMRLVSRDRSFASRIVLEDTTGAGSEDVWAVERAGVPVLIVWGELDGMLPAANGRELHSRLSKSRFSVLPGAGHVPHWERPDEFLNLVGDFLNR
jgi:pimeloyl-ACP methyl ester carboxylesterase